MVEQKESLMLGNGSTFNKTIDMAKDLRFLEQAQHHCGWLYEEYGKIFIIIILVLSIIWKIGRKFKTKSYCRECGNSLGDSYASMH